MPPALAAKQIAGFIVAEPFNAAAEALKVGKILRFTGDVWRDHACCVVFMHERDLAERPAWSQKVVDAIVQAQVWTRAHPQEAAQLLSRSGANHYTPHAAGILQSPAVQNSGGLLPLAALLVNALNAESYLAQAHALERMDTRRRAESISATLYAGAALVAVVQNWVIVGRGCRNLP